MNISNQTGDDKHFGIIIGLDKAMFLIIISLLLLFSVWKLWKYVYTPLPSNAREPWKLQLTLMIFKIINLIVTDTMFDGVKVRIYRPSGVSKKSPALVFFHGGGWVFGSINTHDIVTRRIARKANIIVISVEYRLAPEHVFPAAFDDCVTVTKFVLQHASTYEINASRIGIAGDSAGGQLAMAVCHKLSTEEYKALPKVRVVGLIYPVLQAFDFNLPSYRKYTRQNEPSLINKLGMCLVYNIYGLGSIDDVPDIMENKHTSPALKKSDVSKFVNPDFLPKSENSIISPQNVQEYNETLATKMSDLVKNPYFSPLLVSGEVLQKLPKTYLLTVEYDPLRDEGLILAKRLELIKHDFVHKHWEGVGHGFINFVSCKFSRDFTAEFSDYLTSNL